MRERGAVNVATLPRIERGSNSTISKGLNGFIATETFYGIDGAAAQTGLRMGVV
jgi:hypothetical protein